MTWFVKHSAYAEKVRELENMTIKWMEAKAETRNAIRNGPAEQLLRDYRRTSDAHREAHARLQEALGALREVRARATQLEADNEALKAAVLSLGGAVVRL